MSMGLYKRGPIYHYRFKLQGREYSGTTRAKDLKTAQVVMAEVRNQIILGEYDRREPPTLGAVIEAWLGSRGRSVSVEHKLAAEKSRDALKHLLGLPLNYLTTTEVEDWRSDYLKGRSPATINLVMRYLKMFCRWAMKGKLIREMPYSVMMLKEDKRARPIVEKNQREAFMGAVTRLNPQIPAAATFTMMLGVREAEMLNARWEWLTTEVYDVRSKTKSKKHRVISVPPILHTTLGWMLTYQALARKEELPVQRPQTGLIFPGGGGKPHTRGWLNKALKRGAIAIGVPTLGIHRLRGTFATLHLRKNTPLKEVQEMMGHWSAVTTLGYQETSTVEQKKHQDELWG